MNKRGAQTKLDHRLAFWLIVLLSLAVFLPFVGNHFISDDYDLVRDVSTGGPFAIWTTAPSNFFRPLISLSLWLNYQAAGWNSWAYYLPNFILHAVNVGLVFFIAKAFLVRSKSTAPTLPLAAVSALIFMASPSHVEALYFMSCRTDLLAATFGLASVCTFLRARSASGILLSIALLFLGCCCKESVYGIFLFFGAMLLVDRKDDRLAGLDKLGAIGGFVAVAITAFLRSRAVTAALPYGSSTFGPIGLAKAIARTGLMLVKPVLPFDPGILLHSPSQELTSQDIGFLVVLMVMCFATMRVLFRREIAASNRPSLLAPMGAFLVASLPVCILAMPALSPESGRLMYLPSAFTAIILAFFVTPWLQARWAKGLASAWLMCAVAFTFVDGVLYRAAGDVCAQSLFGVRSKAPSGKVTVFVVPDSINGRYVWRNGFEGALEAFGPQWAELPHTIITYNGPASVSLNKGGVDLSGLSASQISPFKMERPSGTVKASPVIVTPDGKVTDLQESLVQLPRLP